MTIGYVTNTYEIADTYKKILLNAKNANVRIEPSNDNTTKLFLFEKKRRPYKFSIQGDTLTIEPTKSRWYNFLRIGIDHSDIRLCVPESILEALSVNANTGRVDISSIDCTGTIDIKINTGRIISENVTCKSLVLKGNTGSVSLNKVTASESLSINRNTGKVTLNDCCAPKIFVKTNTGMVCGKLPSNIVFTVHTNTGKTEIPDPPTGETIGGRCKIITNTGNIKFEGSIS